MSFIKTFGSIAKSIGKQLLSSAKIAFSSNGIDAISNAASSAVSGLTELARAADTGVPNLPRSVSDLPGYITSVAGTLKKVNAVAREKFAPAMNVIKLLTTEQRDEEKVLAEAGTMFSDLTVANKVSEVEKYIDEAKQVTTKTEAKSLLEAEDSLRPNTWMTARESSELEAKLSDVFGSLATFSPGSVIGIGGHAAIARPQQWIIDSSKHQMTVTMTGASSTDNGFALDLSGLVDFSFSGSANVSTHEEDVGYTSAAGDHLVRIGLGQNLGVPYASWPPKPDCYTWRLAASVGIKFSHTSSIQTYLGDSTGRIVFHSGPADEEKTLISVHEIAIPDADSMGFSLPLMLPVPEPNKDIDFDISLLCDNAVADISMSLTMTSFVLIGTPSSSMCAIGQVDYITGGARMQLNGTQRWSSLFGKVEREYNHDPNFSVEALWNDRSARNYQKLMEVVQSIREYAEKKWPAVGVSIDNKFASQGVPTIVEAARLPDYLYEDGPLAGLIDEKQLAVYSMVVDMVALAREAVEDDADFGVALLNANNSKFGSA
jgi:hypothetical protein